MARLPMKKFLSWLWSDVLVKPWPNLFRSSIYVCIISAFLYVVAGFSIISNPSFLLQRDSTDEFLVHGVLTRVGIDSVDTPHIYVLPKDIQKTFLWPYIYLGHHIGLEESSASFCWPDANEIILQENATASDLFHEIGHIVDYQANPDAYGRKSRKDKEFFAADFSVKIMKELNP